MDLGAAFWKEPEEKQRERKRQKQRERARARANERENRDCETDLRRDANIRGRRFVLALHVFPKWGADLNMFGSWMGFGLCVVAHVRAARRPGGVIQGTEN